MSTICCYCGANEDELNEGLPARVSTKLDHDFESCCNECWQYHHKLATEADGVCPNCASSDSTVECPFEDVNT